MAQAAPELVRLGRTQECPRPARLFEATQLPGGGGFLVSDSGIGLCFAGFEMHTARWCAVMWRDFLRNLGCSRARVVCFAACFVRDFACRRAPDFVGALVICAFLSF